MVPLLAPQMPRSASASRVVTTPHQIGVSAPSLTPFHVPILVHACLTHTEISPQTAKFHLELSNRRIHKPFARRAQHVSCSRQTHAKTLHSSAGICAAGSLATPDSTQRYRCPQSPAAHAAAGV